MCSDWITFYYRNDSSLSYRFVRNFNVWKINHHIFPHYFPSSIPAIAKFLKRFPTIVVKHLTRCSTLTPTPSGSALRSLPFVLASPPRFFIHIFLGSRQRIVRTECFIRRVFARTRRSNGARTLAPDHESGCGEDLASFFQREIISIPRFIARLRHLRDPYANHDATPWQISARSTDARRYSNGTLLNETQRHNNRESTGADRLLQILINRFTIINFIARTSRSSRRFLL